MEEQVVEEGQQELPEVAAAAAEAEATPEPEVTGPEGEAAAEKAPEWTPDWKFKVYDEEKEVDEWLRPLAKDQEHLEKLKDLATRAYGLDGMKEKHSALRDEVENTYKPMAEQYQGLNGFVHGATEALNKGDWRTFAKLIDSPHFNEDKILEWALEIARLRENPEQQQLAQQQFDQQWQAQTYQQQNQQLQQQMQQVQLNQRETELTFVASRPDVAEFAQWFDQAAGRPGAFRQEVINTGVAANQQTGQDLSADQAVKQVMERFQGFRPQAAPPQAEATQAQSGQTVIPARKPTLPNVRGGSTSPAGRSPRSIDDLRKMADQMED